MTVPSAYPVKYWADELIDYLNRMSRFQQVQPLWLGGAAGSPGSVVRPGGYIGNLPQNYVQYDSVEAEYSSGGSSLMDNLAHDRFRLTNYITQIASYIDSGIHSVGSIVPGGLPSWGYGASVVGFSPGSPPGVYTVQDAIQSLYNSAGPTTFTWHTFMFSVEGSLSTSSGNLRLYIPGPMTIGEVFIGANTAPTGDTIIVDIHKNGTTIFTNQANRPTIAAGAYTATSGTPDVTALVKNSYLTMDVDNTGSTQPGANLTVHVRCKQYPQGA